MNYLVDVNVILELRREECNKKAKAFMRSIPIENTFLSTISIGEVLYSIYKESDKSKHTRLLKWFNALLDLYGGRIIPLEADIMQLWGKMQAESKQILSIMDSFLAATAVAMNFTLLSKNIKNFGDIKDLIVVNPWDM
jgi:predicted nucleic acid-binding protein